MAKTGLKFPVATPIIGYTGGGQPIYGTGFIIGKAITAEKSIESNDNPLYADNALAENDTSFSGGSIKLGVADFGVDFQNGLQIQAKMLGNTVESLTGGGYVIKRDALDISPYLGFGFYKTKLFNGILGYEATWLFKTKFKIPSDSTNTKGKSIEWQTAEIEGTVMAVDGYEGDRYEETAVFETEQAAKSWLIDKAHCEPIGDRTALINLVAEINELDPEEYTSATWATLYFDLQKVKTALLKSFIGTGEISVWTTTLTTDKNKLVQRSGT